MFESVARYKRPIAALAGVVMIAGLGVVVTQSAREERWSTATARTHDISLDKLPATRLAEVAPRVTGVPVGSYQPVGANAPDAVSSDVDGPRLEGTLASSGIAGGLDAPAALGSNVQSGGANWSGTGFRPQLGSSASGGGLSGAFAISGGGFGGISGTVRPSGASSSGSSTSPLLLSRRATDTDSSAPGAARSGSVGVPSAGSVAGASGSSSSGASGGSGSSDGSSSVAGVSASAGSGGASASGGSSSGDGTFSTGPSSVGGDAGSVPTVGGSSSPGSSPAATPEPMSLLLVGTGLVGLYKARHFVR